MRILHTSDWHLGRSLHRTDLLGAQAAFVDFLVETVRAERVELVLVAGDLYDRAVPSLDAVALCNDALRRLAATGARTVVISGNHDSASRLGFGADLIDAGGVHLRTAVAGIGQPVPVDDIHGPVLVYAVPYLEPDAVRDILGVPELRGHEPVLTAAMARVRADLARRGGGRSVVLAHAFVSGAAVSDSERDIAVGGAACVPPSVFTGIDYVALGHLHGPQAVSTTVRYSGSPLAYSFSEAGHRKSCALVSLGPGGVETIELLPCPVPRRLARLEGRLADLLTSPSYAELTDCLLSVTLTDPVRPTEPMARLRERFPYAVCLDFAPDGAAGEQAQSYAARVRGRSDADIAAGFVEHVRGGPPGRHEVALLQDAFTAARRAEVAG